MAETVNSRATLVVGGARSGKSRFAERMAVGSGLELVYIATGAAYDAEMSERIAAHQRQRGPDWITVEEQIDLTAVLLAESRPGRAVLADCLTLWLSNLTFSEKDVASEIDRLCAIIPVLEGPSVFVSNEVGMGIVPENRLSRSFRDAQGRLNQRMADVCSQVVFVAAGQPLLLKPSTQPEIRL